MAGLLNKITELSGPISSLIVAPFTELVKQITKNMQDMGTDTEVLTYDSILSMHPTNRDILMCDEAHHIMSETWRTIPDIIQPAVMVGFTGTPYRTDAENLLKENGGIFDCLIMGPTMEELTAQGYLANLEYYSYPIEKIVTKIPFYIAGDYLGSIEKYTYKPENKVNRIVEEYTKYFMGMPTIVFARDVRHATEIATKFNNAGILSKDINCYQPSKLKEEILKDVKEHKVQVLVGCKMMGEGLDAPHLKLVIMARPIVNSLTMFLQQIGRVIRPYENETAKVLDLVGNFYRFGQPAQAAQKRIV